MKKIQKGFTLIELMIVVAIIGILAAVAIPAYQDYIVKAKLTKVMSTLDPIKTALAMYYQEQGGFPAVTDVITTTGTPPTGSVWTSLGFSSYPTIPAEVSALNYVPFGVVGNSASSFAITLTLANIKATNAGGDGINGMFVAISPSSDVVMGATAAGVTSASATVTGGSALTWTYACNKGPNGLGDNVVRRYFANAGAPLVC